VRLKDLTAWERTVYAEILSVALLMVCAWIIWAAF
jgi:hypothetical protein